jgi:iron complex transport system ATP-binding protein
MSRLVEAMDLVVSHGAARALDGVGLTLESGELLGVLGPNGSGKSTLLRVLLGAQRPAGGTVRIHGQLLSSLSARVRARVLTMVAPARTPDFALTVRDVVGLGRIPHESPFGAAHPDDAGAIARALAQTETVDLQHRGLSTLSSGELQRVHLARAFAQEARVLLLDEPTANLDPLHQLTAMRLLRQFVSKGGAAIVVLHDLALAARACDRLLILDRGRVRAHGPARSALDEALLADVFRIRARIDRDGDGAVENVLALEPAPARGTRPVESQGGST